MNFQCPRALIAASALVGCVLPGCGSETDVKLADVPPVHQSPAAKPAANSRIPKNAKFSPSVLPGDPGK